MWEPTESSILPGGYREKSRGRLTVGFYRGHTHSVKTAISVPDSIFKAGERLASRMGVTRSRLYSVALREYVERHDDEEITRRLDAVYSTESSEVDPVVAKIAAHSLPRDSWK